MADSLSPARAVVSRAPGRTVRVINLPTLFDKSIECESSLERDFVIRAAFCPQVIRVRHQPMRLVLPSGRTYVPDFEVTYLGGATTVIEVKLASKVAGNSALFDEAASELGRLGTALVVVTERHIRERRAHQRAELVLRYRKTQVEPAKRTRLIETLASHPNGMAIGSLCKRCAATPPDIFCLAAHRDVCLSRHLPCDDSAMVFHPEHLETKNEIHIASWFGAAPWGSDH